MEGFLPKKKHKITVIAVYQDGVEKKGSTDYIHSGRSVSVSLVTLGLSLRVISA